MAHQCLPRRGGSIIWDIIRGSYHGHLQAATTGVLNLHEKYGWKEQLHKEVKSIRAEVRRQGGIKEKVIDDAIARYRTSLDTSSGGNASHCGGEPQEGTHVHDL
jgi:hypothetical protein